DGFAPDVGEGAKPAGRQLPAGFFYLPFRARPTVRFDAVTSPGSSARRPPHPLQERFQARPATVSVPPPAEPRSGHHPNARGGQTPSAALAAAALRTQVRRRSIGVRPLASTGRVAALDGAGRASACGALAAVA